MKNSVTIIDGGIIINNVNFYDVEKTFDCGQCFRFHKMENKERCVEGIVNGKILKIEQQNDCIKISGITLKEYDDYFKHYLSLDQDYEKILSEIASNFANDELIIRAIKYSGGIRILNQDPWETLCSFIISQNNNIPRIEKIIKNLSFKFGNKIDDNHYAFPTAEQIIDAGEIGLNECKVGFRARYMIDAAVKFSSGLIETDSYTKMSTSDLQSNLKTICGVGDKVASCVTLFSYQKMDSFPIDVWIKKILKMNYGDIDSSYFGNYGGLIQQFLFYYARFCDFGNKSIEI